MPKLITVGSRLNCPHGGTVAIAPAQTRASADSPIATAADKFSIMGCGFVVGGAPHPCFRVEWKTKASRVKAGDQALTDACVGELYAADGAFQGTVIISTQQEADGL